MILKRCHIENFGVLSRFDYDFSPGLTVILRENGFGKSTFAAFLKAMLYGLVKDGNSIEKNERKRFEPWQGGKFGGFLEFTYQDTDYRVTRYFGKTAAKDTFSLWDLTRGCTSTAFSEKLGEELFGLDAKSFARSTYLSQLTDTDPAATTSIQAKLSGLVEDTNDLCNLDTAEKGLKEARKKLGVSQKAGCLIPDTQGEYHALELRRSQALELRPQLEAVSAQIDTCVRETGQIDQDLSRLHRQILQAGTREKQALLHHRQAELQQKIRTAEASVQALDASHPKGYPSLGEIEGQKQTASRLKDTRLRLAALPQPQGQALVQKEQACFGDPAQVQEDLAQARKLCDELTGISARQNAQWLPQEKARLEELTRRFPGGAPSREERAQAKADWETLRTAQIRRDAASMRLEDRLRLQTLEAQFAVGMPEEAALKDCEAAQAELQRLTQELQGCCLTQEEDAAYQSLRRTFAQGVPEEARLQTLQQSCRRVAELEGIKSRTTDRVEPASRKKSPLPLICGTVLALLGVLLFLWKLPVPGGALLILGAGCLAFSLRRSGGDPQVIKASAITEAENQELYDRKREITDFLLRFYPSIQDPEETLRTLWKDTENYRSLQEKAALLTQRREAIQQAMEEKNRSVLSLFAAYFPGKPFDPGFVRSLRALSQELERLRRQQEEEAALSQTLNEETQAAQGRILTLLTRCGISGAHMAQGVDTLEAECAELEHLQSKQKALEETGSADARRKQELDARLRTLLHSYNAWEPDTGYGALLSALRRRFDAYREARQELEQYQRAQAEASAQIHGDEAALHAFADTWGLAEGGEMLSGIEAAVRRREDLTRARDSARQELDAFRKDNPELPPEAPDPDLPDSDTLAQQETQLQSRRKALNDRLVQLRSQRDTLLRTVEEIPQLEDRMALLQEQGQEAVKGYTLLTDTMAYLEQARENLANSYVGKVERRFHSYADTLLAGQLDGVLLDKDLTLHVDAQGEPREVVSFSAGTADALMLCMRLALVDALFEKEKPCLILDDPFVNLDDAHTQTALEMLKTVSKNRQVIYLVCNSGRSL